MIEDIYALAPAQSGMLFHDRFSPGSGVYVVQFACTLEGELDTASFEEAWQRVVRRHAILRTAFHWEDVEAPVQVVHREAALPFAHHDLSALGAEERSRRVEQALRDERARGLELGQAPLMRCALYRTSARSHEFVWTFHHLLLDGWSSATVLQEVLTCYEHLRRGLPYAPGDAPGFGEYIAWIDRQDTAKAADYWRGVMKSCTVPTPLPASYPAAAGDPAAVSEIRYELTEEMTASLQSLARRSQLTLNTVVQGAWALLMSRHTGEQDVVFGATVSGRPPELGRVQEIAGMFINTLPVRVRVEDDAPLVPWLKQLRAQQAEMQPFEFSPLVDIHRWCSLPHNRPLFESIVVFENYPIERSLKDSGLSLDIRNVRSAEKTNFPLTLVAMPGARLSLGLEYDPSRFAESDAARLLRQMAALLGQMASEPDRRLGELDVLPKEEVRELVHFWNNTRTPEQPDTCFTNLFEAQAERTPGAPAIRYGDQVLTYAELDRKANQAAHYLRARGLRTGDWVGIFIPRSPEMVIAMLGILKAGGAYVPLDPTYPRDRIRYMLEDSRVRCVLTHSSLAAQLPPHIAQTPLDSEWDAIAAMPGHRPSKLHGSCDFAYMIYTSGSTGRPKGVMVHHAGLANYVTWGAAEYRLAEGCGVPVQSPLGFDMTVLSLHGPLIAGGCAWLLPEDNSVEELCALLERQGGFSILNLTPAHLEMLRRLMSPAAAARAARTIVVGGEALPPDTAEYWSNMAPGTRLVNEYGPTETVVGCSYYRLPAGPGAARNIPIGGPIANTTLYILDRSGRLSPLGATGELCIGGAGVAYGYLNRPDLTAEKFVPDPFGREPGARLYRSGDLARRRPDGVIECLGRVDHQVKIRGFRIEPGEVESALAEHPGVREALVVGESAGSPRLVAYLVPERGSAPTAGELREFLGTRVPPYMVPSAFVEMESFPLTPNGKLDRAALPSPDGARMEREREFAGPRTPLEEALCAIWAEVLGLEQAGIHDNFFECGGHSLLATQAVSRICELLQIALPLRRLFEAPTVAALAAAITADPALRGTAEEAALLLLEVSGLADEDASQMLGEIAS